MVTKRHSGKACFSLAAFAFATSGFLAGAWAAPQTEPAAAPAPMDQPAVAPAPTGAQPPAANPPAQAAPPVAPMAPTGPIPRVYHAAVYSALPGEPLEIKAGFDHPELIRRVVVVVLQPSGAERLIEFKRGNQDQYVAVVPGEIVKAPGLSYAIEIEHVNGSRVAAFASRTTMHPVNVIEDITDTREKALLARLGGRRSIISIGGEFVGFGENTGSLPIPCGPNEATCAPGDEVVPTVKEQYYRVEAGYTYRSLRTVSEFGFRLGVLRGQSLKTLDTYESDQYEVGLNFGAARVRFRLLDLWQFEGELLTSITEKGFSSGFNFATHIGDPYGTKLILGFERLGLTGVTFGNRIYSRMDIVAGSRMVVSPIVEITDMPNAQTFGVRLLAELSFKIAGGFSAQVRGGYQARKSDSGGPGVGGSLSYAF